MGACHFMQLACYGAVLTIYHSLHCVRLRDEVNN